MIFGEYTRLKGPDALLFRNFNQRPHQSAADATAPRRRGDVDADFGHSGVHLALRHRAQSGPAENAVAVSDHQSALRQMAGVPPLPIRRFGFKRRLPGGYTFDINRPY